tara:strand:- start:379 stop:1632 length:1254 start_codon:yes stop_codon:yes gene_type:complete
MSQQNPNYISSINRNDSMMNPLAQQLLLGGGGTQGFLPQAITASNRTFFNEDGTPKVYGQKVAGFNPDQRQAFGMTRDNIGMRDPYYSQAQDIFGGGLQDYQRNLANVGNIYGDARNQFGGRIGQVEDIYQRGVSDYNTGLDEVAGIYRDQRDRRFNPRDTQRFFNPFEDQVVQRTITDVMDSSAQREQGALSGNIRSGGQSAFGSRAKLGAQDRMEALGRGLGESISNIRRGGYDTAMSAAERDYGRAGQQDMTAATGLSNLYGSRFNAESGLGANMMGTGQQMYNMNTGYGGQMAGLGQNLYGARSGYANQLTGLGDQMYGAGQQDINSLLGIGGTQQGYNQRTLDARTGNQRLGQQAYMNQINALSPFYSSAISQAGGPSSTSTAFQPKPSALGAGLNMGLGAFGALGNYFGQR